MVFHGDGLLAPRRMAKLEDHPLSDVSDCLLRVIKARNLRVDLVEYTETAHRVDRVKWRALVNTVMKLRDPQRVGISWLDE